MILILVTNAGLRHGVTKWTDSVSDVAVKLENPVPGPGGPTTDPPTVTVPVAAAQPLEGRLGACQPGCSESCCQCRLSPGPGPGPRPQQRPP